LRHLAASGQLNRKGMRKNGTQEETLMATLRETEERTKLQEYCLLSLESA